MSVNRLKMSMAIMLTEPPSEDVRGAIARTTIRAASRAGYRLLPVLFNEDAVYTLLPCRARSFWLQLAEATGISISVCPAAAERRGVPVEELAADLGITPMGLPGWLGEALDADRVLQF